MVAASDTTDDVPLTPVTVLAEPIWTPPVAQLTVGFWHSENVTVPPKLASGGMTVIFAESVSLSEALGPGTVVSIDTVPFERSPGGVTTPDWPLPKPPRTQALITAPVA